MTNKDDGGAAFPHDNYEHGDRHLIAERDMTLRDWFAGMALQGLAASHSMQAASAALAYDAYALADAMIAERAKRGAP